LKNAACLPPVLCVQRALVALQKFAWLLDIWVGVGDRISPLIAHHAKGRSFVQHLAKDVDGFKVFGPPINQTSTATPSG
ncbi:MAG: hypothetical protein NZM37_05925, partial [Sandaracinaceae bacterium]|nr:hypothetical protein [Sandaracinaceae bacterium]